MTKDWGNKLYFGDNLHVLREQIQNDSMNIIYLDPSFNSKTTYNVFSEERMVRNQEHR